MKRDDLGHQLVHPTEKADMIADCLENRFTPHELCDENHKRLVEARVEALLEEVDNSPIDIQKVIHSLKLCSACVSDGIPNARLGKLPSRPLVHRIHEFKH